MAAKQQALALLRSWGSRSLGPTAALAACVMLCLQSRVAADRTALAVEPPPWRPYHVVDSACSCPCDGVQIRLDPLRRRGEREMEASVTARGKGEESAGRTPLGASTARGAAALSSPP